MKGVLISECDNLYLFDSEELEVVDSEERTGYREPADSVNCFQKKYKILASTLPESVGRSGLPEMMNELEGGR